MYVGHKSDDGTLQPLREHLEGVGRLAAGFAKEFGGSEHAYRVGLMHDLGKYSPAAQKRMLDPEHTHKVDHSTAGAQEAIKQLKDVAGAFAVAGHHGGLPDLGGRGDAEGATLFGRNKMQLMGPLDYSAWRTEIELSNTVRMPLWLNDSDEMQLQFYIRMLFSCLVDADFLDTERFMQQMQPERGCGETMEVLYKRLCAYVSPWLNRANTTLNERRNEILAQCLHGNELPGGMYTLTVPTGGGKTISSLGFALAHAAEHGLKRVIYVIPYTSIIEQNAAVFSEILGSENVLEHYSNADYLLDGFEDDNTYVLKKRLATENWDAPIIVTTAVQFFESLYAGRTSKCRKLHNMVNSVIIFDEAQMLPLPYLRPCVAAITEMVKHYGVTAVLCTATQPSLDDLIHEFAPEMKIRELCSKPSEMQVFFRRVSFEWDGELSEEHLADILGRKDRVLCIVNTRKRAQRLYAMLPVESRFHLSTLMTPEHRSRVLKDIRLRLQAGLTCHVVSTSLIEAGVDVDFPEVWREETGLDSMLQAAGRCNREGRRLQNESKVHIFRTDMKRPEMIAQNIAAMEYAREAGGDIDSYETIRRYFNYLHKLRAEQLDAARILDSCRRFEFRKVAEAFRMIDSDTEAIYIPDSANTELLDCLRRGEISRGLLRRLGRSAVNVYRDHLMKLRASGKIEECGGFYILADMSAYDAQCGLTLETDAGAAIWI